MTKPALAFALLLGSTTLAACLEDAGTQPGPDDVTPTPTPTPLVTDGAYVLESTLAVEAGALLPGTAYEALQTLEGLRDHPAETLFDLAEDAGVPAVGTLRDALPSALESRLYGWIDEEVRAYTTGDGSLARVLDQVLAIAHTDVGEVRLGSALTLSGDTATHRLDTVALAVMDQSLAFDVAPLAAIGVEREVSATAAITQDAAGASLTLGAHGFGLPYGKIAWRAMEQLVSQRYGRDLRALIGDQVQCPAIAANVADRCVLGVCVGHEAELESICEAGLDRAVSELRTRVEAATIQPIALDAGAARLTAAAGTDQASTIDGTWTARLDLGQGLRPAPATFAGSRE